MQIRERDFTVSTVVTQPFCNGNKGSIQISVNDVEPQYTFEIYEGETLVNSVGPIIENTYLFDNLNAGTYQFEWNGKDTEGQSAASGIYFYSLLIDGQQYSGKLVKQ